MILYLHGFRSSPLSFKARLIAERLHALGRDADYYCPQLPASPRDAVALASQIARRSVPAELTLIGSSLGGYYATWLAEQLNCRAVLLNPAIRPSHDLAKHVGVTTAFHSDHPFEFKNEYIDELKEFSVERITNSDRYLLVAATGDELLDWREMVAHYPDARHHVIEGSDHGISDFGDHLDAVLTFCGITETGL